jgi:hypothetical protein
MAHINVARTNLWRKFLIETLKPNFPFHVVKQRLPPFQKHRNSKIVAVIMKVNNKNEHGFRVVSATL